MDILQHNRSAWNKLAKAGIRWSTPVSTEAIEKARAGDWSVILTPTKHVPDDWFGDIRGKRLLCLASGGGQQAPTLAAAGAKVTCFDNSDEQLALDRLVADRDGLELETIQGDMADLSAFADQAFDLIFHPVSNVFAKEILPVWRECARVLKPGGRLLSGFMNPFYYLFDHYDLEKGGPPLVKYAIPFSDIDNLPKEKLAEIAAQGDALEFSHCLETQIGGQTEAGLLIAGLYEDSWDNEATPLNRYMTTSIATLALKPSSDR